MFNIKAVETAFLAIVIMTMDLANRTQPFQILATFWHLINVDIISNTVELQK